MPPVNAKYSYKSFGLRTFLTTDPAEFSGTTIRGSGWSFETLETQVFPAGTKDVRFEACRLDNVTLPPGSVLDADSSNYQFKAVKAGEVAADWCGEIEVDAKDPKKRTFVAKAVFGSVEGLRYKGDNVKPAKAEVQ